MPPDAAVRVGLGMPQVPGIPPAAVVENEPPVLKVGAIALFLLLFISFSRLTDFLLAPLHLPLIISLFCFAMSLIGGNLLAGFRTRVGLAFTGLTVWLFLCVPLSFWPGGSFDLVTDTWIKSFALFVITAALISSVRQSSQAVRVLAAAFLTTAALGFVYGRTVEGRFGLSAGLYRGSNELATAMVQGCIFCLYMVNRRQTALFKRIFWLIALIPMVMIMLNTASRAGVIALAVVIVSLFFRYSMQGRVALIVLVCMGAVGVVAVAPGSAGKRIATIFGGADDGGAEEGPNEAVASSKQRAYLLLRSLQLTMEHPVFGVGPGQFAVAEASMSNMQGKRGQWLGTHNTYTEISSEDGVPALLFFLGTLLYCWKALRETERLHRNAQSPLSSECMGVAFTLRLALISYVVFYCFEHIGYAPFYPALAGLIVGFTRASRKLTSGAVSAVDYRARHIAPSTVLRRPNHKQPGFA